MDATEKKKLSEIDICDLFITPAIRNAGWEPETQIRREVTLVQNFVRSDPSNFVSWGPPDFVSSVPPDFGRWVPPAGRVLSPPRRSPEWSADVDVRVQMPISRGTSGQG